jgi:hypothetical protein
MKVCIQRTTFGVIEDQAIIAATPFVPQQLVQAAPVFNYIISNKKYIEKKKCALLVHPRKIAKTIPSMAIGNIVSSDMLSNMVDNIHDKSIHDLVHAIVIFVKYAMMAL